MIDLIFKAVLSNQAHPEYGSTTIPSPIPNDEYDHPIKILESLSIGDALAQDGQVDALTSGYTVLDRLLLQSVNVDELDYLTKRLDSFCQGEQDQFQAMASKQCLSDIAENLDQFGFIPGIHSPEKLMGEDPAEQ